MNQQDRIEEAIRFLGLGMSEIKEDDGYYFITPKYKKVFEDKLCQLFPQPLDGKECSRCYGKGEICLYHSDRKPYWSVCPNCGGTGKLVDDKELRERIYAELSQLALDSGNINLKSYVVGLLAALQGADK